MRRFSTVFIALIVAGLAVDTAAQGQGRGQGQGQGRGRGQNRPAIRFAEMDTNRDRVITKAEWRGSTRSFAVHDWNSDGILSGDEVRVGAQRPSDPEPDDLESVWDDLEIDDWTVESFRILDRNSDGRIVRAEWYYDRETFNRVDHNGDNAITEGEFTGNEEVDDDREDQFEYLDANNDGRISRSEWHGTRARFDALDRNRDNVLTRAEATGTEPPADAFAGMDTNNDRSISRTEWRWSAASFDLRDTNRDGRLSRDEFAGITSNRPGAYKAGYDRGLTEGRIAGRDDRVRNAGWDLEGQRELEQADSGYQTSIGPRAEYQAGYREGFRRGYREGWDAR